MTRWRSDDRYYLADLHQDLLGQWVLLQAWGSLHSDRGSLRRTPVESWEVGLKRLRQIATRRKSHGYRLVDASAVASTSSDGERPL
ncbi:MAG: hypothetical protein KDH88_09865 [Chromatiales bacterium]|nr:hypothetical protein [Chromatiales bacterium]